LAETDKQRHYESIINRKKTRKPMITITDDDGRRGFYTILFELAKEYNIPFTSAMITERAMGFPGDSRPYNNNYYHYNEVVEMQESGLIEFVSHTHNHNKHLTLMTDEELHSDFSKSNDFMKRFGFNSRAVVYPYGYYDDRVLEIAKEYFDYSTGAGNSTDFSNGRRITLPPINNYTLPRRPIVHPLQDIKDTIDETVDKNGWLILLGHIDGENEGEQKYRDIIEYALSKGVEFVTLQQGMEAHGNIAQFGGSHHYPKTSISSDGEIHSDEIGKVVFDYSTEINNNTPLEYFKPRATTKSIVRAPQMDGFPTGLNSNSGMLTTHRGSPNEDFWSYQTFLSTNVKRLFMRWWDYQKDVPGWTDWVDFSPYQHLGVNGVLIDDKATSKKLARKISISTINNDYSDDFPENEAGHLVTNAIILDGFAYQEYTLYRSERSYRRYWIPSSESWGNWDIAQKITLSKLNEFDGETPINDFPSGVSFTRVQQSHNTNGLPVNASGSLATYKLADNAWNYQEFIEYNSTNKFIRNVRGNGLWGDWKKFVVESV